MIALLAPVLAPYEPNVQDRSALLVPPFWEEGGSTAFLLGTDAVGRDILSRLIYGARFSLFIGLVVVSIALAGGVTIGLISGYVGGVIDTIIMRVMDVILAFPSLLAGAGAGGDPRAGARERDDRHRHRAAAAFRAADPGLGLERGGAGLCHLGAGGWALRPSI